MLPPFPNYTPVPSASQRPRKSYRWVWITLVILPGFRIIGGALFIWGLGSAITIIGSPTITSDEYYNAIREQDYARAYSFLGDA